MRTLFLALLFASCLNGTAQTDSLLDGRWHLFKIIDNRTGDEIIPPKPHADFYFSLVFSDSLVRHNREINKCDNSYRVTGPHQIKFLYFESCTEICCDKEFSDLLTYEECSAYFIKDRNTLVLVSEDRVFYLSRAEQEP